MRHLQKSIAVTDRSSVGEARRAAITAAQALEFDEGRRSDISIVVTELANNVLRHATAGELLLCPVEGSTKSLDIIALDTGPGIRDVSRAFEDGVSTSGTAGQGLGAVERLSDIVSLYSIPGKGTVVFCRFKLSEASESLPAGVVNIPITGEIACGDSYLVIPGNGRSLYMMVDGLGHGAIAAEAALEAVKAVQASSQESLTEIMTSTHNALKATRGAAMSIALVDHERSIVTYAGVGNISASLGDGITSRNMVSQNGTLGAALPRVQEFNYPFGPGTALLMFSDGLNSKCGFSGYPGILNRPHGLIAGLLYRDFSRRRDDATVLVASLGDSRT
ncbi:MAG: ATP-binding SpoIIE family protein phosphatase [Silvibacterium sp.]